MEKDGGWEDLFAPLSEGDDAGERSTREQPAPPAEPVQPVESAPAPAAPTRPSETQPAPVVAPPLTRRELRERMRRQDGAEAPVPAQPAETKPAATPPPAPTSQQAPVEPERPPVFPPSESVAGGLPFANVPPPATGPIDDPFVGGSVAEPVSPRAATSAPTRIPAIPVSYDGPADPPTLVQPRLDTAGFPLPLLPPGTARGGSGLRGGGPGAPVPPRRRRSLRWLAWFIPLVVILGGLGAAAWWAWSNYEEQIREVLGIELPNDYEGTGNGVEAIVTIRPGDTGADIAATLHREGVTMTFDAFYDLLLTLDPEPAFQPGNYALQQQMSAQAALEALLDPATRVTSSLYLPEGAVLPDILEIMASTTGIPIEEFQALANDPGAFGLSTPTGNVEGYLFPATYDLDGSETAASLMQRVIGEMIARLDALGVPPELRHEVLTKASIVQRESGPTPGDMEKVARVFQNRLDQGWHLESDATVTYGVGNYHSVWTTPEQRADASNPYNTYANPGLPIGPVGAPSEAAINAVLHPAEGDWMFFAAVNLATGETAFSTTVEEHEAAVQRLWEWCEASDENAAYCE